MVFCFCEGGDNYVDPIASGRSDVVWQPVPASRSRQNCKTTRARLYPVWIHKRVDLPK